MVKSSTAQRLADLVASHRAGRLETARLGYEDYLRDNPGDEAALNNLGALYIQTGNYELAASTLKQLSAAQPASAIARCNLGYALLHLGYHQEAEHYLRESIALEPRYAVAHTNLGVLFAAVGRREDARVAFERALEIDSRQVVALTNLGEIYLKLGESTSALSCFDKALAIEAGCEAAVIGRARALALAGDTEGARAELRFHFGDRFSPEAWLLLGLLTLIKGDYEGAENCLRTVTTLRPDLKAPRAALAHCLLLRGEFHAGWREYETRDHGLLGNYQPYPRFPAWGGQTLPDASLLVFAESGFGDVIQFVRFASLARSRVARLTLLLNDYWRPLAPLLRTAAGIDEVLTDPGELDRQRAQPIAAKCSIMSFGFLFDVDPSTTRVKIPYIVAPDARVDEWRARLPRTDKFRVGIAWYGSARLGADALTDLPNRRRSIAFSMLAPLGAIPGVELISLQKDRPPAADWPDRALPLIDLTDEIRDFADTAALIANLDLVIAVDTAVVHLAGAMGKSVWLLNRLDTDWRWGIEASRTPWYPSLRIFRQRIAGHWSDVLSEVAATLGKVARLGS